MKNPNDPAKKQCFPFSNKDQIFFSKRLSFLLKAGIPLLESLDILRDQAQGRQKQFLDLISSGVSDGGTLSASIASASPDFNGFGLSILEIGESTGSLSDSLEYLSDELHKRMALKRKVIGAFIYPAIVSFATLSITLFLVVYLFPKITPVFLSLHMKLPVTTRLVIALSAFLRHDGLYLLVFLLVIIPLGILFLKKNAVFRTHSSTVMLRTPFVGSLMRDQSITNLSRTLGLLLQSGLPLSEALPIASRTIGNPSYERALSDIVPIVHGGGVISTYLFQNPRLFPIIFSQIIAAGERGGTLSASLIYLSKLYEEEVQEFTKRMSEMIEPLLMIVMGLAVGFLAISIITPIYGITQSLHP